MNSETVGNNSEGNKLSQKWENLADQVKVVKNDESSYWTNELETESKQFKEQQAEFEKKSILEKLKAKITGKAPNQAEHDARMAHGMEKRGEAYDKELYEAGMTEDELFRDRVKDVDQAYEMAKASNEYETKAAELRKQANEAYDDGNFKKYNKKMDAAGDASWRADKVASETAEEIKKAA